MNIAVCVKQVPNTAEIRIDREKNTLIRNGFEGIINPFDTYALEMAARLKDRLENVNIIVLSMGIEQAKASLEECLAIAADKAYLISDKSFAGSDTFATAYILSAAIRLIEQREGKIDAVFCGLQAIDGDTAQVGPELAENLGYPQLTNALDVTPVGETDGPELSVTIRAENGIKKYVTRLPCLITFTKIDSPVRAASLRRKIASKKQKIFKLSLQDLREIDPMQIGLNGSPTKVKRTYVNSIKKDTRMFCSGNAETDARELINLLKNTITVRNGERP